MLVRVLLGHVPARGRAGRLGALRVSGLWTRQESIRTLAWWLFEVNLDRVVPVPVYQKIAAEAAEMDAQGARISLMAQHFGVNANTVKKAIAWFYVLGPGS